MKDLSPSIIPTSIPSLGGSYAPLDILGNTFGRYFDYKKETTALKEATHQMKIQANVAMERIDAELQAELDRNDKFYRLELKRLKTISNSLKDDKKARKELLQKIDEYLAILKDPTVATTIKASLPHLISETNQLLSQLGSENLAKLNHMSGFNPNTKLIKE